MTAQSESELTPYPRVRRLACTTYFDDLECSQDHSKVRVAPNGDAHCAYGHHWTDQRDAYGRAPKTEEQDR